MLMMLEQKKCISTWISGVIQKVYSPFPQFTQSWPHGLKVLLCWPTMMQGSPRKTGKASRNHNRVGKGRTHSKWENSELVSILSTILLVSIKFNSCLINLIYWQSCLLYWRRLKALKVVTAFAAQLYTCMRM